MNLRRAGFTLLEVMIASAIGVVMILATYLVFSTSLSAQSSGEKTGYLEERGRILLDRLVERLRTSNILFVETSSTLVPRIDFQVPVDPDGNGSVVNVSTGKIDWGSVETTGHVLTGYHRFQFQAQRLIQESVIKQDLNGDGDQNDTFALGRIVESSSGGTISSKAVGGDIGAEVMFLYGNFTADLNARFDSDGDGNNANAGEDVMFVRLNGADGKAKQITVGFWLVVKDSSKRYVTHHFREVVMLRNTQS